ncbi:hypothetical protein SteCoe_6167 [Stentor coeruleus]|uniref:Uncharacterized protein n=1 Tax=Stentor coeruleus TaxID=5963 RepID=A0A1R2CQL5_9CILI|nr:hypothetical protein SteCoe_6167 [Stentor coeruleus]
MSSSSLTFCDQHMAWQQRVGKEINAAARLYESFQNFSASRKSVQSSQHFRKNHRSSSSVHPRHEKKSLPDSVKSISAMKNYLNTAINVYAEVRGKYARPAPQLNQAVNPVLNRPTTAGSLRARSCRTPLEPRIQEHPIQKIENSDEQRRKSNSSLEKSQRPESSRRSNSRTRYIKPKTQNHPIDQETNRDETMLEKVQERIRYLENASKSVLAEEKKLKAINQLESSNQNKDVHKKPEISDDIPKEKLSNIDNIKKQIKEKAEDLKDLEDLLRESPDKNSEDTEKNFEDEKSIREKDEGNKEYDDTCKSIISTSRSSWKTTSSQRRYIQELESLLREEKLRRMKLEEVLNTIISK